MRIMIWDMDWFYKKSFLPNYKAQKISSFHKQKNDLVYFIETEDHLNFDYDLIYIIRDSPRSPMPPIKYIDVAAAKLVGDEFKFYSNHFNTTSVMDMLRPDYQLYPINEKNIYSDANVLQLFSGTNYISKRQDHQNYSTRDSQRTLVVDEMFWKATEKNILLALKELKTFKNIVFLNRISLKKLLDNKSITELFLELDLAPRNPLRFRNDLGPDFETSKKIIDLYRKIKDKRPQVNILPLPIRAVSLDHWAARESYFEDLKRCLMITDYAKQNGIHVILKTALRKNETPFYYIFDRLEAWTTDYERTSYIESMASSRTRRTGENIYSVLNNREKWSTPNLRYLLTLLAKDFSFFEKYGTRQWKDDKLNLSNIDQNYIKQNIYGRFDEFKIIDTLQEEN